MALPPIQVFRGTVSSAPGRGPLRAFHSPQYRAFWVSSLFSIVSFFVVIVARGWLVLDLTDSPLMVTAINATQMLPMLALPLVGGVIADRGNRKALLVVADLVNLAALAGTAFLLFAGVVQVWHVFALTLVNGVAFSLSTPVRASIVPGLVPPQDLTSGVALFSTIFSVGQVAGPAPAGYLISEYGMGETFLTAAVVLLPALGAMLLVRMPQSGAHGSEQSRGSVLGSIVEGLRYVRRQPLLLGLLLTGLVATVFAMPFHALLPVVARDVLGMGPDGLGWLLAAMGVGAIAGSFAVAAFTSPQQLRRLLLVGSLGAGLLMVLFAVSHVFLLSLGLAMGVGLLIQGFMTSNFTLVQVAAPEHLRGRILSVRMVMVGVGPFGMVLLGVGAEVLTPSLALAGMGVLSIAFMALVLLRFPALRRP